MYMFKLFGKLIVLSWEYGIIINRYIDVELFGYKITVWWRHGHYCTMIKYDDMCIWVYKRGTSVERKIASDGIEFDHFDVYCGDYFENLLFAKLNQIVEHIYYTCQHDASAAYDYFICNVTGDIFDICSELFKYVGRIDTSQLVVASTDNNHSNIEVRLHDYDGWRIFRVDDEIQVNELKVEIRFGIRDNRKYRDEAFSHSIINYLENLNRFVRVKSANK